MKRRGIGGIALAAVVAASALGLSGCVPLACPTVGYLYLGPAIVEFSTPPADEAIVAACFGEGCEPAEVSRPADGRWVVPQEDPYMAEELQLPQGEVRDLRVVVTGANGAIVSDEVHEIPVSVDRQGFLGQCPGPFEFESVTVQLPN